MKSKRAGIGGLCAMRLLQSPAGEVSLLLGVRGCPCDGCKESEQTQAAGILARWLAYQALPPTERSIWTRYRLTRSGTAPPTPAKLE